MWVCFYMFSSSPLSCVSVFMPVTCSFNCYSFVIQFEIREYDASSLVVLSQDCFCYSDFLCVWFLINFGIICSVSLENVIGVLIEIAVNLQIVLDSYHILTVLILPIHEHGISFHLFVSFSIKKKNFNIQIFDIQTFSIYRSSYLCHQFFYYCL